jgi:hypothetical protein
MQNAERRTPHPRPTPSNLRRCPPHASRITHHVAPYNFRSPSLLHDPPRTACPPLPYRCRIAAVGKRAHRAASATMVCPGGHQPCPTSAAIPAFVNSGAAASLAPALELSTLSPVTTRKR